MAITIKVTPKFLANGFLGKKWNHCFSISIIPAITNMYKNGSNRAKNIWKLLFKAKSSIENVNPEKIIIDLLCLNLLIKKYIPNIAHAPLNTSRTGKLPKKVIGMVDA